MTTTQGPQHRATIRVAPGWYPVSLQLRYKTTSKHGPLYGFGETRMMSSKDIIFGPSEGLKAGMGAEIAVAWPLLLDGHIHLQLVLDAIITASEDGLAAARILAYDFRTCRPGWARPQNGAAGWRDGERFLCISSLMGSAS